MLRSLIFPALSACLAVWATLFYQQWVDQSPSVLENGNTRNIIDVSKSATSATTPAVVPTAALEGKTDHELQTDSEQQQLQLQDIRSSSSSGSSSRKRPDITIDFAQALGLGRVLLARGEAEEAALAFRVASGGGGTNRDQGQAKHGLGLALRATGRPAEALEACRDAERLDPELAVASACVGSLLTESGDAVGALIAFRSAAEKVDVVGSAANSVAAGEDVDVHGRLGAALVAAGEVDEAIPVLIRALEGVAMERRDHHAAYNLGVAWQSKGETDKAIAAYSQAVELAPELAPPRVNLGAQLLQSGRLVEAEAVLLTAVKLGNDAPSLAAAHSNLGAVLQRDGRTEEALEAYLQGVRWGAGRAPLMRIAKLQQELGRPQLALEASRRALLEDGDPLDTAPLAQAGLILESLGSFEEAAVYFDKVTQLDAENVEALMRLGSCQNNIGNHHEALNSFVKASQLEPEKSETYKLLHSTVAEAKKKFIGGEAGDGDSHGGDDDGDGSGEKQTYVPIVAAGPEAMVGATDSKTIEQVEQEEAKVVGAADGAALEETEQEKASVPVGLEEYRLTEAADGATLTNEAVGSVEDQGRVGIIVLPEGSSVVETNPADRKQTTPSTQEVTIDSEAEKKDERLLAQVSESAVTVDISEPTASQEEVDIDIGDAGGDSTKHGNIDVEGRNVKIGTVSATALPGIASIREDAADMRRRSESLSQHDTTEKTTRGFFGKQVPVGPPKDATTTTASAEAAASATSSPNEKVDTTTGLLTNTTTGPLTATNASEQEGDSPEGSVIAGKDALQPSLTDGADSTVDDKPSSEHTKPNVDYFTSLHGGDAVEEPLATLEAGDGRENGVNIDVDDDEEVTTGQSLAVDVEEEVVVTDGSRVADTAPDSVMGTSVSLEPESGESITPRGEEERGTAGGVSFAANVDVVSDGDDLLHAEEQALENLPLGSTMPPRGEEEQGTAEEVNLAANVDMTSDGDSLLHAEEQPLENLPLGSAKPPVSVTTYDEPLDTAAANDVVGSPEVPKSDTTPAEEANGEANNVLPATPEPAAAPGEKLEEKTIENGGAEVTGRNPVEEDSSLAAESTPSLGKEVELPGDNDSTTVGEKDGSTLAEEAVFVGGETLASGTEVDLAEEDGKKEPAKKIADGEEAADPPLSQKVGDSKSLGAADDEATESSAATGGGGGGGDGSSGVGEDGTADASAEDASVGEDDPEQISTTATIVENDNSIKPSDEEESTIPAEFLFPEESAINSKEELAPLGEEVDMATTVTDTSGNAEALQEGISEAGLAGNGVEGQSASTTSSSEVGTDVASSDGKNDAKIGSESESEGEESTVAVAASVSEEDAKRAKSKANLGLARLNKGQTKKAAALFEKAASIDPGWWKAPYYAALAHDTLGDAEAAAGALVSALSAPLPSEASEVAELTALASKVLASLDDSKEPAAGNLKTAMSSSDLTFTAAPPPTAKRPTAPGPGRQPPPTRNPNSDGNFAPAKGTPGGEGRGSGAGSRTATMGGGRDGSISGAESSLEADLASLGKKTKGQPQGAGASPDGRGKGGGGFENTNENRLPFSGVSGGPGPGARPPVVEEGVGVGGAPTSRGGGAGTIPGSNRGAVPGMARGKPTAPTAPEPAGRGPKGLQGLRRAGAEGDVEVGADGSLGQGSGGTGRRDTPPKPEAVPRRGWGRGGGGGGGHNSKGGGSQGLSRDSSNPNLPAATAGQGDSGGSGSSKPFVLDSKASAEDILASMGLKSGLDLGPDGLAGVGASSRTPKDLMGEGSAANGSSDGQAKKGLFGRLWNSKGR